MPAAVAAELQRAGGFWPALLTVLPALGDVARRDAELDQRRTVARRYRGSAAGIGRGPRLSSR